MNSTSINPTNNPTFLYREAAPNAHDLKLILVASLAGPSFLLIIIGLYLKNRSSLRAKGKTKQTDGEFELTDRPRPPSTLLIDFEPANPDSRVILPISSPSISDSKKADSARTLVEQPNHSSPSSYVFAFTVSSNSEKGTISRSSSYMKLL
jgi:hypothetical protein